MNAPELTNHTTAHGRAPEALGTIEPTGLLERLLAGLLLFAYERRYLGRCTEVSPKDGPDEQGIATRSWQTPSGVTAS